MAEDNEIFLLPAYYPLVDTACNKRFFVITGGRASGKSYNVALYYILKLMAPQYFRGIVARYQKNQLKFGIGQDIIDLINKLGLKNKLKFSADEILNEANGNKIISHSFKLSDQHQVAKSKGIASPTHLLIDEAQELPSESEYIKAIDSIRTLGADCRIILLLNPTTKFHWIYERFWMSDNLPKPEWKEDHCFIHTTYFDNIHPVTKEYLFDAKAVTAWERVKTMDPKRYAYDYMGLWSDGEDGRVYDGWDANYQPDPEAPVLYGLDFGFSNDPTALVKVQKHNDQMWIKELIYQPGLTMPDLARMMVIAGVPYNAEILADHAPMMIEELKRLGYTNIKNARKGSRSNQAGINKIKSYQVHLDINSKNIWEEYNKYLWKKGSDEPVDKYNHALDAVRYALSMELDIIEPTFFDHRNSRPRGIQNTVTSNRFIRKNRDSAEFYGY